MKVRNTFIIFLVSGFWHGANWTFIVWGGLNAIYFLPLLIGEKNRNHIDLIAENTRWPSAREFFSVLVTFVLTVFAWIFFRANNLEHAFDYIGSIFTFNFGIEKLMIERFAFEILPLIVVLLIIEWFSRAKEHPLKQTNYLYVKALGLIAMILIFGSFSEMQEFIYFQF